MVFLTVVYLGYKNVDIKRAIGTSAAIGFPIAITGTIGYMINGWTTTMDIPHTFGFIYIPVFLAISIASAISAPYGARCSHRMPEANLKKTICHNLYGFEYQDVTLVLVVPITWIWF